MAKGSMPKANIKLKKASYYKKGFQENLESHFLCLIKLLKIYFEGINFKAAELIQYLSPVGAGPSLKT